MENFMRIGMVDLPVNHGLSGCSVYVRKDNEGCLDILLANSAGEVRWTSTLLPGQNFKESFFYRHEFILEVRIIGVKHDDKLTTDKLIAEYEEDIEYEPSIKAEIACIKSNINPFI